MHPILSTGLLIGLLCGVWMFVMGFTNREIAEKLVLSEHTARNQHGDVVAVAVRSALILMRPEGGASE